jgi:hypothetical protein
MKGTSHGQLRKEVDRHAVRRHRSRRRCRLPGERADETDGLVNVNVGDVTILEDVNIAAAVDAVAVLCPAVSVSDIAILADQTDTTSRTTTVCRTEDNDKVRFTQN